MGKWYEPAGESVPYPLDVVLITAELQVINKHAVSKHIPLYFNIKTVHEQRVYVHIDVLKVVNTQRFWCKNKSLPNILAILTAINQK